MGDFAVRKIMSDQDRSNMYQYALNDIAAFEEMLKSDIFETEQIKIGAEQELCLVDHRGQPATKALDILDNLNHPLFTNELALFNLEINLDPVDLKGSCFTAVEKSLLDLMTTGRMAAKSAKAHLLMCGILPTLKFRHLQFEYMTPVERYKTLSKALFDLRGTQFEIHLQGVDEVIMSLGSVLFEACNTSFQLHLQIRPDEFVAKHNWAQMIAGPVLSSCVNSPLLFGNELWAETRIALFKQSLDTRSSQKYLRKKLPRVYFGNDWISESAAELWKNDLMRFPLILTSDNLKDSIGLLAKGEIPDLRAIRLHNGTTYTWNRLCYGHSKTKPHLRIECRYLPSGPSGIDEVANFAFWIGLMNATPVGGTEFWKDIDFRNAKNNFIKAGRTGLNTVFNWYGQNYKAKDLILDQLLPLAKSGLQKVGVSESDISKYLSIIEKRTQAEITGSEWTVQNFRALSTKFGRPGAERILVQEMLHYQQKNIPVHEWDATINQQHSTIQAESTVEEIMSTDIFSINNKDSIELAKSTLIWNNIHHLPVEDIEGNLVGLITDGMIQRLKKSRTQNQLIAEDIMIKNPVTIQLDNTLLEAKNILDSKKISGLPVVYNSKLVGIITQRDFSKKCPKLEKSKLYTLA